MSGHLDLDRLADLLAGEGSDTDVAHVADCTGCAGRLDELATAEVEVAAVLAALPAPTTPPELSARLTAALAALPPLSGAEDGPFDPGPAPTGDEREPAGAGAASRTVTPFPTGGRRSRFTPLAAAAALVVVAGTGAALVLTRSSHDNSTSSAAAGPAAGADKATGLTAGVPTSSTGTDYAAAGSVASALPALLYGGVRGTSSESGEAPQAPTSGLTPFSAATDPLARLRQPEDLAGCLAAVEPPGTTTPPLALDYASYGGAPALVVVLPDGSDAAKVDVFVVGAGCRQGDDGTLFFTRVDRPAG